LIWIKPHLHLRERDCSTTRSIAGRDQAQSFPLREAADPRTVPAHHQAIAVVLDFVDPQRAGRWPGHPRRLAGCDEAEGKPPLNHGRRIVAGNLGCYSSFAAVG
jgi:hypothetical protein